jgi:hypothetical protein
MEKNRLCSEVSHCLRGFSWLGFAGYAICRDCVRQLFSLRNREQLTRVVPPSLTGARLKS